MRGSNYMSEKYISSPTGWWIGSSYFENKNKNEKSWINSYLIRAVLLDEAFSKLRNFSERDSYDDLKWVGVCDLMPIYEELCDGSEIIWQETDVMPEIYTKAQVAELLANEQNKLM